MRGPLVIIVSCALGALVSLAEAGVDVGALDMPATDDADVKTCARDGKLALDESDGVVLCKTLASATVGGRPLRVFSTSDNDADTAYVELAGSGGGIYYDHVMHYSPAMGERSSDVQTARNWSGKPRIGEGTLADGSKAAVVLLPWSSHSYARATGKLLDGETLHGVIVVCSVGAAADCSQAREVDCSARGCKPTLVRGVLSW